jgi:hypothetical protein
VVGNTILNDKSSSVNAVWNNLASQASVTGNAIYNVAAGHVLIGAGTAAGNTTMTTAPAFSTASPIGPDNPATSTTPVTTTGGTSTTGTTSSTGSTSTTSKPAAQVTMRTSEDAWNGDAQFTVALDGNTIGGVHTTTALHSQVQSQALDLGSIGAGVHSLALSFINDAYGGTPSTDRNLYLDGFSVNGSSGNGALTLLSNGTKSVSFGVSNAGSLVTSTLTLNVSEDAWNGDAQFMVVVDGKQMGGIYTATASHAAGQSQAITVAGIAESYTGHDIAISFINDSYGGTAATDRNLYLSSAQFDGQTAAGAAHTFLSNGTQHISALAPTNWLG